MGLKLELIVVGAVNESRFTFKSEKISLLKWKETRNCWQILLSRCKRSAQQESQSHAAYEDQKEWCSRLSTGWSVVWKLPKTQTLFGKNSFPFFQFLRIREKCVSNTFTEMEFSLHWKQQTNQERTRENIFLTMLSLYMYHTWQVNC